MTDHRADQRRRAALGLAGIVTFVVVAWVTDASDRAVLAWLGVFFGLMVLAEVVWPGVQAELQRGRPWVLSAEMATFLAGAAIVKGGGPGRVAIMAAVGAAFGAAVGVVGVVAERWSRRRDGGGTTGEPT